MTLGLSIVALAGGLRAIAPGFPLLLSFTILFGIGVGITQPAFPRLSRGLVPNRIGFATSIYAAGFFLGAVIASFLTGPFLLPLSDNETWRLPLAIWGGIAGLSLVIWIMALPRWSIRTELRSSTIESDDQSDRDRSWSPWRNRQAWIVAGIFAGQGLAYYLMVAWLPSVYEERGLTEARTAGLYTVFQLATFPAMVGMPVISDRIGSRKLPTLISSVAFLIGGLGLVLIPDAGVTVWIWPAVAGFGVAGLFGMGLLMPTDISPAGKTGIAAGMVLAVGYVGSGAGPVIGGVVNDVTGSLETALAILPVLAIGLIALSWLAPKPRAHILIR